MKQVTKVTDYATFLTNKAVVDTPTGFDSPPALCDHLFDFQEAIVRWALIRGRAAIFADCGLGKGLLPSARVLTPTGWKTMADLAVGDSIIGADGKPHNITGVFHRGVQPTYKVRFCDGTSIICDDDHLWAVKDPNDLKRGHQWRVLSTRELRQTELKYGTSGQSRKWRIPLVEPIEFANVELPLHPYVLGVLLGDGCLGHTPNFSKPDVEIADEVAKLLPDGIIIHRRADYQDRCESWSFVNEIPNPHVPNKLVEILKSLGLQGKKSADKFIPQKYLFGNVSQREALLQGLMDTDGYCGDPTPEFSSASRQLAEQVVFLVQSLGGVATISCKEEPTYTHNGEKRIGQPSWRVVISLPPSINPFKLKRKADKYRPTSRGLGRWIDSIEYAGEEKTICIKVDAPDELFVTEHCIVTHNTVMQLEWAHHVTQLTGKPVLILAPLSVVSQTVREGEHFGFTVNACRSASEVKPGINITNYEILHKFDCSVFSGVVLDESSILKAFTGSTRNQIINSFAQAPFKLACTATPAPNDYMELGNHSEFLGVMSRTEMLAMFFVHDGGTTSQWRLKGHAQDVFWRWLASWAVCIRKPSDIGFSDVTFTLPPLNYVEHVVPSPRTKGHLFATQVNTLDDRRKARHESMQARVQLCADMVNNSQEPWIVWCDFNAEGDALEKAIPDAVQVSGSDTPEFKAKAMQDFADGKIRVLVTKSVLAGFGLNWQHCNNMAFVGLSDSFEQFYQAVRRCWRFGQDSQVNVHIITSTAEGNVIRNVQRKERDAKRLSEGMVRYMEDYMKQAITETVREVSEYKRDTVRTDKYVAELGDCVEVLKEMESNSIHYSIFSPPFANLYTYSNSDRDMGNCKNHTEFAEHFKFAIKEMYRVLIPGRLVSFHCMNLPTAKCRGEEIGIEDFRGDLIRMFKAEGFIFHSEVVIWKDPVTAMQRTKAIGLLHKQLKKDSCMSRQGIPDYLVTMRKPGDNPERVTHTNEDFPVDLWQRYASPVWMDINPSDTLQRDSAREAADERHVCPLQLQVIRRALKLWSNPNDIVLSPFMGIGSEGYVALQERRRFHGIELKESYFKQAVPNLESAAKTQQQHRLFELPA